MDFGKVKILLIVVFLGLNIFLAYQWSVLGTSVSIYTEPFSDQVANIKRTFAGHGVAMNAALPAAPSMLSMTLVSLSQDWFQNAVDLGLSGSKKALAGRARVVQTPLGSATWVAPDQVRITYRNKMAAAVIKADGRLDGLHKWLLRHVYNFNQYQLLSVQITKQKGSVEYVETVGNYSIFSAPLVISINQGKVVSVTQTYVGVGKSIRPRPVLSAANALLAVASYMDKAQLQIDNTIKDMQLGYASSIVAGESGYLSPVWRVASVRGYFYVNALNGEVSVQNR